MTVTVSPRPSQLLANAAAVCPEIPAPEDHDAAHARPEPWLANIRSELLDSVAKPATLATLGRPDNR